jgi:hypothetical protein
MRIEDAAIDVAAEAPTELTAFEVLAEACRSRRTTPQRLVAAVDARSRLPRRRTLLAILDDLATGSCSVLERGYLQHVERRHGLPTPRRQHVVRAGTTTRYRDIDYPAYGLVVELDGRLFHDTAQARDRDLERDLDSALDGRTTIRPGWGQVLGRSCRTAGRIAALLQRLGGRDHRPPAGPTAGCDSNAVDATYMARRIHRAVRGERYFLPAASAFSTRARPSSTAFA